MLLKKFYINVLVRVALIVLSGVILGIVLQHITNGYFYTLAGIIFLIGLQAILLINKVNKTNIQLEKFLSYVQEHNSSLKFPEDTTDSSFKRLHDRMNDLNKIIQNVKIENERTKQFLQKVVDHVDVGLVAFDLKGGIEICNKPARKYLNIQHSNRISSLKAANEELFGIITSIKPGQDILYKMKTDYSLKSILIKATELKFENSNIKLLSFEDITNELDKKEMNSWQKLIRVLTHEIMNSISPITSLTSVVSGYFINKETEKPVNPEQINQQTISKTLNALNTIEETGNGLLNFVEKYRNFTLLPKPNLSRFSIEDLFQKCKLLMETDIPGNIQINTSVSPANISLSADIAQIEQVLINLVKNAIEALVKKKNGIIHLKAYSESASIIIQVEDNGSGIPNNIIEDIFVPFFTTKENGSGIGLSLSRQIMQNHNGTISVSSIFYEGTSFTLRF